MLDDGIKIIRIRIQNYFTWANIASFNIDYWTLERNCSQPTENWILFVIIFLYKKLVL